VKEDGERLFGNGEGKVAHNAAGAAPTPENVAALPASREVKWAIVHPEFIVSGRRKPGLDQRDSTWIFGGGVSAFSRPRFQCGAPRCSLLIPAGQPPLKHLEPCGKDKCSRFERPTPRARDEIT